MNAKERETTVDVIALLKRAIHDRDNHMVEDIQAAMWRLEEIEE